jgi:hypothetical protein
MSNIESLSVTDLMNLKSIIELACSRGTFRANEMVEVGTAYQRLSVFLDQIVAEAQTQADPTQQGKQNDT